jgi:hypothetical protein
MTLTAMPSFQTGNKLHNSIKNQLMHLLQKTLFYIHIKNTKNLLKSVL